MYGLRSTIMLTIRVVCPQKGEMSGGNVSITHNARRVGVSISVILMILGVFNNNTDIGVFQQ